MHEGLLSQSITKDHIEAPLIVAQRKPIHEAVGAFATNVMAKFDAIPGVDATFRDQFYSRIMPDSSMAPNLGESVDIERGGV